MIPPAFLRVRIKRAHGRNWRLWIPIILLWPIVLALALVLAPVLLLWAIAARGVRPGLALGAVVNAYLVVCAFRGLTIDFANGRRSILVSVR